MPLLEGEVTPSLFPGLSLRRQSEQYSDLARTALMSSLTSSSNSPNSEPDLSHGESTSSQSFLPPPPKPSHLRGLSAGINKDRLMPHNGVGAALTDTPLPSAPASPQM